MENNLVVRLKTLVARQILICIHVSHIDTIITQLILMEKNLFVRLKTLVARQILICIHVSHINTIIKEFNISFQL